jgi:hypothetical protein
MRQEDLCGRMGEFHFVVVLSGSATHGEKFLERIREGASVIFTSELVQWASEETSLQLLYRLDRAAEITL